MKSNIKYIKNTSFGQARRVKLIKVSLPNGNVYWIRPFQLELIEKDLKYMHKVSNK